MTIQNIGGIYAFSGRVTYAAFADAAEETVRGIVLTARPKWARMLQIETTTRGGKTASVGLHTQAAPSHLGSKEWLLVRVNLPTLNPDALISATYATRLLAYVLHETLHILDTDLNHGAGVVSMYARAASENDAQPRFQFYNAVEDYAIEHHACDPARPLVGNAGALLGALNDEVLAPYAVQAVDTAKDARAQAQALVLALMNRHGRQHAPALDAVQADAQAAADPAVLALVRAALDKIDGLPGLDNARARIDVAMLLWDELGAQAGKGKGQPDKGKGEGKGKGQPGKGEGEGKDGADGQPGEDGQPGKDGKDGAGKGKDAGKGGKPGEGEGEGKGKDAPGGAGKGAAADADGEDGTDAAKPGAGGSGGSTGGKNLRNAAPVPTPEQARAQALADAAPKDAGKTTTSTLGTANAAPSLDQWRGNASRGTGKARNGQHDTAIRQGQAAALAKALDLRAMETAMRRGLTSVENITLARRLQSGRLDRRASVRVGLGALDTFTRRTVTPGMTTAVVVMVDGSGSMNAGVDVTTRGQSLFASRWTGALAFLSVMAPAIERAGAQSMAAVFSENYVGGAADLTVFPLKGWTERAAAFKPRALDLSGISPDGGTPMEREARWAARELSARRVDRRVCLWLCDGEPSDWLAVSQELARQRRAGIEHYAICIGSSAADRVFGEEHAATVYDAGQLPGQVERLLMGGRK